MTSLRKGVVEYRERAFEQDAAEAIRGDVIRALIELITNSDDAYAGKEGPIALVIERQSNAELPIRIRVKDQARGLTADGLINNFSVLGNEKDEKEQAARGLFGRGAKDVATLGAVTFKAIRDGKYSELVLDRRGHWEMLAEDEAATSDQRADLGLSESDNGLTVDLAIKKGVNIPSRLRLQDNISNHAQLRDLVGRRRVFLTDGRDKSSGTTELQALAQPREMIVDEMLAIPGYDSVQLVVRKLPQRESGGVGPYSTHGLLVSSGVSTFENSWFDLDNRQEAGFFAGSINAPQISEIIKAYDKGDNELGGPTRLLSRSRDGLIKEHPYRKALSAAVTGRVKPLFDDLARSLDANKHQGEELNNALKVAREALREHVREILDELEDEDEGADGSAIAALAIIPPRRVAAPNESLTFTIRMAAQPHGELSASVEQASPQACVTSVAPSESERVPHSRLEAVQTNLFVMTGGEEGTAVVRAEVDGHTAYGTIIIRQPDESDEQAPEDLEVTPALARVAPGRRKRFLLRAPMALEGVIVAASCDTALVSIPEQVVLRPEPGGRWVQAVVSAQAGQTHGKVPIHIWAAGKDLTAQLFIEDAPIQGGLEMDFQLSAHKKPTRRSELIPEAGVLRVHVYPLHPSFNNVFGKYSEDDEKFTDEDSPQARAVFAEVIAAELAGYFTERDYDKRPDRLDDAPRVLRRRTEICSRLLAPLHRSLKPRL